MKWVALILGCLVSLAMAKDEGKGKFEVEKQNRATFLYTQPLRAGDKIHFKFRQLSAGDQFLINQCGERCNTSRLVFQLSGPIDSISEKTYEIAKDGSYYFWIQRTLPTGESGPSFVTTFSGDGKHFAAKFMTGSDLSGDLMTRFSSAEHARCNLSTFSVDDAGQRGAQIISPPDVASIDYHSSSPSTGEKVWLVTLTDEGAAKTESFTKANHGKKMSIVCDEKEISRPVVMGVFSRRFEVVPRDHSN